VSPNFATLNQSLIFFSHIVTTTGCYQYLSRIVSNPYLSAHPFAAAQPTEQVTAHEWNQRPTLLADDFCVHFILFCAVDKTVSLLLTQGVNI